MVATSAGEQTGLFKSALAEGAGFEPARGVNPCRFSRPFHAFQTRQIQTKRDQGRLMAACFIGKACFAWFCPDLSGLGSSVYQMCTMEATQDSPGSNNHGDTVLRPAAAGEVVPSRVQSTCLETHGSVRRTASSEGTSPGKQERS